MAIGGFNGTDPAPTLAEFKAYVRAGRIHYFLRSGVSAAGGDRSGQTTTQIAQWVEATFPSQTVDGVTVYDLTGAS
jgi:hypothetical protein